MTTNNAYKCSPFTEERFPLGTTFPQNNDGIELIFLQNERKTRSVFCNSPRKKMAIAGFGGIVFFLVVISLVCVSQKDNSTSTLIRRDFEPLYNLTTAAMNKTMNIYCTHLPLLFSDNCDEFTTRYLKRMDSKPPQLALPPEFNINDKDVYNALLVNMSTLMQKYIIIFDQIMKQEYDILCHPFVVAGINCGFPESCTHQKNDSNSTFYCEVHSIHYYLTKLNRFFENEISDAAPPNTLTDDVPYFSQGLPSFSRRWYTMAFLNVAINQVEIFHNVLQKTGK